MPPAPRPEPPRRKRVGPVRNYLEVFGIPPTLSVLLRRLEEDAGKTCFAGIDAGALAALPGEITYQNRKQARQELDEPRVRAIRAAQSRLACEGLLTERSRHVDGMFDLPTHEALAVWERKNDIFGWGFLGGETAAALARPPLDLHLATFQRILTERVADAAGIIEDGTVAKARNVIGEHVTALRKALELERPENLALFLRRFSPVLAHLHVAFRPPPLPAYYSSHMELEAEIDRGDVWYDFPFDGRGEAITQKRERYPSLTLFVRWKQQRIALARWRTTIGSWRSELDPEGRLAYKYKNSDVGPRIWKHVVAAPVWIPPESTPGKDLLTRKIFDVRVGPVDVVNTEVMGPGFQSAYGLVMAIHHKVLPGGGLFDNQIRTHGSVDYTSIARRFSHGCHRLVNTRAVRLFGFLLRRRPYVRMGDSAVAVRRFFEEDSPKGRQRFGFELTTRGYYYELRPPVPVNVLEGRVAGAVKKPITTYVPRPATEARAEVGPAPGP